MKNLILDKNTKGKAFLLSIKREYIKDYSKSLYEKEDICNLIEVDKIMIKNENNKDVSQQKIARKKDPKWKGMAWDRHKWKEQLREKLGLTAEEFYKSFCISQPNQLKLFKKNIEFFYKPLHNNMKNAVFYDKASETYLYIMYKTDLNNVKENPTPTKIFLLFLLWHRSGKKECNFVRLF